ncbi:MULTISPECIES: preprotein translocase subunit SecE [unclassified Asaia]|uniref:preprotein translocase subunit SecE n=1 Tax=unclassified Asaia TaxID=2685023 RepID=UPI0018F7AA9D|nr:preprotein translocase subunit SecE [Asaia sp. W19]
MTVSVTTPKHGSQQSSPSKGGASKDAPKPSSKPAARFNLVQYLKDVRTEATRVTWPTRRNTLVTTGAVLAMAALTSVFFFVVDQVIGLGVRELFGVGG